MSAKGERAEMRQRKPALLPELKTDAQRAIVRRQLERLWAVVNSPAGDALVATLRRATKLPHVEQARMAMLCKLATTTPAPASANKADVAKWILAHALKRGLAVPGLKNADLFLAVAEELGYDEDLGAIMDQGRDWRAGEVDDRRLNQRKIMTRRSRLNTKRRKHGYSTGNL